MDAFKTAFEQKGPEPLFVFVNLMEAHSPYDSSKEAFGLFLSDDAYLDRCLEADIADWILGDLAYDEQELVHLGEHYDAEVSYVDYLIRQMIKALQKGGQWDSTIFIVTADHGEYLGEHGLLNHQLALYEETLRVPLIIHYPTLFPPGSRENRPAQLTDVFPTVLTLAGIDAAKYPSQGVSLLPGDMTQERPILCEYFLNHCFTRPDTAGRWSDPRLQRYKRRLKTVRQDHVKLIRGSDGSVEVYDLGSDPGEEHNLAEDAAYQPALEQLNRLLDAEVERIRIETRSEEATPESVDEGTKELLEGLGYL